MNIFDTSPFYISYAKTLVFDLKRKQNMYRRLINHLLDKKRDQSENEDNLRCYGLSTILFEFFHILTCTSFQSNAQ